MSSFSDMLSFLRKRADLSQKELADKIGVSRSTIGMYETGVREPDFEMLEALADVFNVNMDTLLGKSQSTSGDQSNNNTVGSRFIHFPDEADEIAERYRNLDDHGKGAVKAILSFEEASVIAEKRQHKPVQPRSGGGLDMTMAKARRRAGLLQRQVAQALNVSLGTVAMWDTGRNKPRADMLPKIAKLYGCTVDDLLEDDNEKE